MQTTYPDKYGTTDHKAVTLRILLHSGDDYREKWRFVSRHIQPDGNYVRVPLDLSAVVFDSNIFDGDGATVGAFDILDHDVDGVLEVSLAGPVNEAWPVGTYRFWVDGADTDTGIRRTYVNGTLEILRR